MTINPDELRKVAEAATPGPWRAVDDADGFTFVDRGSGRLAIVAEVVPSNRNRGNDSLHIATFDPPTVLALLSRLEQAEQAVERAKAECARQREHKGIFARRATEAEQAVQRVREVCESDSYDMHKDYGNGELAVPVDSIMNALDSEPNE